jgi:phosphoribosylformimino-5-aminoimidazole carboxamide ribotide isomerase
MLIYPAIDIQNGKCVRLKQGQFDRQKVYADDPVDVARGFAEAGFSSLHVVDLDGARTGRLVNTETIQRIVSVPSLSIQVGGGIRTMEAVTTLFDIGVTRVILGSVALREREAVQSWMSQIGPNRLAFAVDARNGFLAADGWTDATTVSADTFIDEYQERGAARFICTDISRDGMMQGPSDAWYAQLLRTFPSIELVASGGVSSLDDLTRLRSLGVYGAIVGTALLDGSLALSALKDFHDADS